MLLVSELNAILKLDILFIFFQRQHYYFGEVSIMEQKLFSESELSTIESDKAGYSNLWKIAIKQSHYFNKQRIMLDIRFGTKLNDEFARGELL